MTDDNNIVLKKEYRYCYDRVLLELPAGVFDENEKDGLKVAQRELLEETGYMSDEWEFIARTIENPAKMTNYNYIYLARNCCKVAEQNLDESEDIDVVVVPFMDAIDLVMDNKIETNSTAHGILAVARKMGI